MEDSALKVSYKNKWGKSGAGYYHIPLLYIAFGRNGFSFCLVGQNFTVSWSNDQDVKNYG